MNLLVLGEARSLHTQRMVRPFADAGHNAMAVGLLFCPDSCDALAEALLQAAHEPALRAKAREANPRIVAEKTYLYNRINWISLSYESLLKKVA
jgi:hypothetical protein